MRFFEEVVKGKGLFVEAKLHERDGRHERMGDSRYVLEPNIKDGKGGLRDLHTLFWIAKYLYRCESIAQLRDEGVFSMTNWRRFDKAQRFLWTVRCHLHYLTARAEERLTFDLQPELAREMGYADREGVSGVERFMKHYFLVAKDVGDLTRIFIASLKRANSAAGPLSYRGWVYSPAKLKILKSKAVDSMLRVTSIFTTDRWRCSGSSKSPSDMSSISIQTRCISSRGAWVGLRKRCNRIRCECSLRSYADVRERS